MVLKNMTKRTRLDQLLVEGGFFENIEKAGINWSLGSDIGGGPFLSMFDVMNSFVKQNKKRKNDRATFTKALYRSTYASAKILGLEKKSGNLDPGKSANFIFVSAPPKKRGEILESFLKRLICPRGISRNEYKDLVVETFLEGHRHYGHL